MDAVWESSDDSSEPMWTSLLTRLLTFLNDQLVGVFRRFQGLLDSFLEEVDPLDPSASADVCVDEWVDFSNNPDFSGVRVPYYMYESSSDNDSMYLPSESWGEISVIRGDSPAEPEDGDS